MKWYSEMAGYNDEETSIKEKDRCFFVFILFERSSGDEFKRKNKKASKCDRHQRTNHKNKPEPVLFNRSKTHDYLILYPDTSYILFGTEAVLERHGL